MKSISNRILKTLRSINGLNTIISHQDKDCVEFSCMLDHPDSFREYSEMTIQVFEKKECHSVYMNMSQEDLLAGSETKFSIPFLLEPEKVGMRVYAILTTIHFQ